MRKRIQAFALCILLICGTCANAVNIGGSEITAIPSTWTTNSSPDGKSAAEIENGGMRLYFDTTASAAQGKSEIKTQEFDLSGGTIVITLESKISSENNSDKVEQSLTAFSTTQSSTKLISIKGGTVSLLGGKAKKTLNDSNSHKITLAIDPTGSKVRASAQFDGEMLYSGEWSEFKTSLETDKMCFMLRNNASESIAEKAEWSISRFDVKKLDGAYAFSSIPENGQTMVSSVDTKEISLNFGTTVSDLAYSAKNYTLTTGAAKTPVEFTVSETDKGAKIVPSNSFDYSESYTLTVNEIRDVFGNLKEKNIAVSFSTAPNGYVKPIVSLEFEPSTLKVYKNQRVPLEFSVNTDIEKMEIFVDGTKSAELECAPYVYYLKETTAKRVKVRAASYDSLGGVAYSDEAEIVVSDHNAPTITVSGISNGASYDAESLPQISVTATDDNAIARITFSADGNVVETTNEATAQFGLTGLSGGVHTLTIAAEDIYGLTASKTYSVTLTTSKTAVSYKNDFSDYNGGNALPRDMSGGKQRGYIDVVTEDSEHGKSLALGIDTADASQNDPAYVGVPMGAQTGRVRLEADLLVKAKPAEGDYFRISLKKTGSTEADVLYITKDEMQILSEGGQKWNNTGKVGETAEYEAEKWYHMTLEVDVKNKKYTLNLNGKTVNGTFASTLDCLDQVRIFGPLDDSVKTYIAVDNVVVSRYLEHPTLTFQNPVDCNAASVEFVLSEELEALDLNTSSVSLFDEMRELALESVSVNGKTVTIVPQNALESNMNYKVSISGAVRYAQGPALGLSAEGEFSTSQSGFEITEGTFDKTEFRFKAKNGGKQAVDAVVICQVWDGLKVKKVFAKSVSIGAGTSERTYTVQIPSAQNGERVTVYVWDKAVGGKPLSTRIFVSER